MADEFAFPTAPSKRLCLDSHSPSSVQIATKSYTQPQRFNRSPESLLDISAKIVAEKIPFQRVEERYDRIPEPVQERIIYWAFPRNERDICMYSSMSRIPLSTDDFVNSPFYRGIKLLEYGCVKDVLQVGFHISGEVISSGSIPSSCTNIIGENEKFKVALSFDRCKITSVTCTCDKKEIFWCKHVVAVALFRLRYPKSVKLRLPISETLLQMNRQQLQKFVQYLIAEHYTEVLPTAQKIADEILQQRSEINRIAGAPDPTAGGAAEDANVWHLDENQIRDEVKNYLSQGGCTNSNKEIISMFAKAREMLRLRDTNGSRMLSIMTDQFLSDPKQSVWKQQATPMSDKTRSLWDQLGALWVFVVLHPECDKSERLKWRQNLDRWSMSHGAPLEDPDFQQELTRNGSTNISPRSFNVIDVENRPNSEPRKTNRKGSKTRLRTVFHKAIDATMMSWQDEELQQILNGATPSDKSLLWKEHLPTACARVEALRTHGFPQEALRLAVAVVRNMKHSQIEARNLWSHKEQSVELRCTPSGVAKTQTHGSWDGWIGHSLNPIGILFDTLTEASLAYPMAVTSDFFGSYDDSLGSLPCLRYRHIPVDGSNRIEETYLSLAVEAAIIGLGHQSIMPPGLYAQEKACKQEERLLARLKDIEWDSRLGKVLQRQANLLLEMGPHSGLGWGIHPESIPMQKFAKFLFVVLLNFDFELAFRVGLRAMRMPVLEEWETRNLENIFVDNTREGNDIPDNFVLSRIPRWYTLGHIENHQSVLASTMINAARGDTEKLELVVEATKRHTHSPSHLFKVAQDALRFGVPQEGPKNLSLINVAYQLGLQVMRLTLASLNWRRRDMVRWIVSCALELGLSSVLSMMQSWKQLFTPTEAVGSVATALMSHAIVIRLGLDFDQQEELAAAARTLALACAREDPASCALSALTLCENDSISFETAYQIVVDAASHVMTSSQLFTVARYMEHRGHTHRAHKLSMLALNSIQILNTQETHPSINDVHWSITLACSLGKKELENMLPIVVKNIHCATVLSEILRRCSTLWQGQQNSNLAISAPDNEEHSFGSGALRLLLDATMRAYVATTHSRLKNISPRHYSEFIEFLLKARQTFLLAPDGARHFKQMLDNMKLAYRGKKKLIALVKERFD